jgi:hypothetical protein
MYSSLAIEWIEMGMNGYFPSLPTLSRQILELAKTRGEIEQVSSHPSREATARWMEHRRMTAHTL